jgi:hypothetical protein
LSSQINVKDFAALDNGMRDLIDVDQEAWMNLKNVHEAHYSTNSTNKPARSEMRKPLNLADGPIARDAGGPPDVENSYPAGLTAGEILKALDRFYDTPENIRIPIGLALTICRQRLAGLSEVDAQKNILVFRSAAAAIPAEKQ